MTKRTLAEIEAYLDSFPVRTPEQEARFEGEQAYTLAMDRARIEQMKNKPKRRYRSNAITKKKQFQMLQETSWRMLNEPPSVHDED